MKVTVLFVLLCPKSALTAGKQPEKGWGQRQLVALVTQSHSAWPLPNVQICRSVLYSGTSLGHGVDILGCLPAWPPLALPVDRWVPAMSCSERLPAPSDCCIWDEVLPRWQWHVGTVTAALNYFICSPGSTGPFLPKQQSLFVAGEVTVAMGEVPHPCDLWLIKTVRIRVYFQALAQRSEDTTFSAAIPPLDKPWTSTEGLRVVSCYQLSLRYSMLVYSWFSIWLLIGVCWCGSSSTCSLCKDFYNLSAFPALWLLPTFYCPGSWKDTRTIRPANRPESTPQKVKAEAECHDNHIFLIQRYPTHWWKTVLAKTEKPKEDWCFAALCGKSWKR